MPNSPSNVETKSSCTVEEDLRALPVTGSLISSLSHHGWQGSYLLSNWIAEVIVVPAIGRVMQFRFAEDNAGPFWQNRALDGQVHHPACDEWLNFGGDKCWPAPQSAWPHQQGRDWPPPRAFDAGPVQAAVNGSALVLTAPMDSTWGIQVVRKVELDPNLPKLRMKTEYRKLSGPPVKVAIWTVTQMQEPECVCMSLAAPSIFDKGYVRLLDAEPAQLRIQQLQTGGRVLSLARHRSAHTKIGADCASLAWIGRECVVRIAVERLPGEYPDGGCLTEIYTNPDPLHYVELETLGPLVTMSPGDQMQHNVSYTLAQRTCSDPQAEAQKVFGAGCA